MMRGDELEDRVMQPAVAGQETHRAMVRASPWQVVTLPLYTPRVSMFDLSSLRIMEQERKGSPPSDA